MLEFTRLLNLRFILGVSVILLPEVKWTWEPIIKKIQDVVKTHPAHYCLIVVAEGISLPSGGQLQLQDHEATSKLGARPEVRLGGVGNVVADKITSMTGMY